MTLKGMSGVALARGGVRRLRSPAGVLLVALAVIALPALVRAQFQQPTDEEIKMTADPKAPDAAAVYFNVEEVTDDPIHFHSFYARIKVLQEKGKELATVTIPYQHGAFKVTDIKGRTIHSDGTVIPLTVQPEDLFTAKAGDFQVNRMVFTLPSVEVGSILEYRYELRYDDDLVSSPNWEIQRPYFVHKAHYAFTPSKQFLRGNQFATSSYLVDSKGRPLNNLLWWPILPAGASLQTDAIGRFSVDVTDIPPIPDEEWMPPIHSILYKVIFYYKASSNAPQFWADEAKSWSKDVDHFAETSAKIKEAVAGIVSPGDSDLDKAKKIYKAVQALDNTDYSRKKDVSELKQLKLKEAKHAEDTWAQKSGSSEDIAQLYLAMARAAGLTANAMKVVDRSERLFDPTYLDMDQFDTTLAVLTIDGKETFVDPGNKMCPFGLLNWKNSNTVGLKQAGKGQDIGKTPQQNYKANTSLRSGDLTLDAHGSITGLIRFIFSGQEALRWRQSALRNDLGEVKKQFDRDLASIAPEGVEAHVDHFLGLDDPDANLMVMVNVQGSLGTATSKRLLLPGFLFEARGNQPFVNQDKRLVPVDMHYGETDTDEIVYHLPAGLAVEGAPQDAQSVWAGHAGLGVKTVVQPGQITIMRSFARAFDLASPQEYQDLRGFYQKVAASDQQQLVLSTSAAVKGN